MAIRVRDDPQPVQHADVVPGGPAFLDLVRGDPSAYRPLQHGSVAVRGAMGTAQTPLARAGVAPTASEAMAPIGQRLPHLTIAYVDLSQYILLDRLADAPSHAARIPTIALTRLGELKIDILNRHVCAGTSELHLTGLEQNLLYLFAANAGRLLTRDEILNELRGVDFVADSNVVDRHARNPRIKLQDDWRRPRYISTVPGRGYRFVPTTTDERDSAPSF